MYILKREFFTEAFTEMTSATWSHHTYSSTPFGALSTGEKQDLHVFNYTFKPVIGIVAKKQRHFLPEQYDIMLSNKKKYGESLFGQMVVAWRLAGNQSAAGSAV